MVFLNIVSDFISGMLEVNELIYFDKGMDNLGDWSSKWFLLLSIRDKCFDIDFYI